MFSGVLSKNLCKFIASSSLRILVQESRCNVKQDWPSAVSSRCSSPLNSIKNEKQKYTSVHFLLQLLAVQVPVFHKKAFLLTDVT